MPRIPEEYEGASDAMLDFPELLDPGYAALTSPIDENIVPANTATALHLE